MPAPITHLLGHFAVLRDKAFLIPAIVLLFLAIGPLHDRLTMRRIHPVSLWPSLAIFLLENVWASLVVPSRAWHAFAATLIR
jgi:hypothetical protein